MTNLTLNQIINIGASKAFAGDKLAPGERTTGRRRRERQRQRRHQASSNSPYPKSPMPPGTSNSQFTHIQILPNSNENEPQLEPTEHDSSEPVFRKPSLMLDTRAAASAAVPPTTESLANNTQGATFAAKARAAELQAARARRELKAQPSSNSAPPSTHETMTFKSKRGSRAWKRVNLSDLPGPSGEDDFSDSNHQDSEANLSSLLTSKNASSDNIEGDYNYLHAFHPTLAESSRIGPHSDVSIGDNSPYHTVQSVETDNISGWMTPTMDTSSDRNRAIIPSVVPKFRPSNTAEAVSNRPALESRKSSNTYASGSVEDFYSYSNTQPQIPIAYTQPAHIPPLRSKPPHHYPAVKGTQSNLGYKFPPPGLPTPTHLVENQPTVKIPPYSGQTLLQHETQGRHGPFNVPMQPTVDTTTRTVLHDPFAPITKSPDPVTPSESGFKQDLYQASEELPWKSRIVPVVTPQIPNAEPYPEFNGFLLTPNGAIKIEDADADKSQSSNSQGQSYQSGKTPESSSRDDRFNPGLMPWMRAYVAHTRAQNVQRQTSLQHLDPVARFHRDQQALARANFSDERQSIDDQVFGTRGDQDRKPLEELLLGALGSLKTDKDTRDYFNKFGPAPEWCIDHSVEGNKSFFGGDWGAPPRRVGRDPRYAFKGHASYEATSYAGIGW